MTAALPPALRDKLVKVCARMASDHDGERAAAALLASRMLAGAGLSWEQVIPVAGQSDVARMVMDAVRTAQANAPRPAAKPRRSPRPTQAYVDPDEARRAARFQAELAFVREHLHLLRPSEQREFEMRDSGAPFCGWDEAKPTRQDVFNLDLLAGVIRRRMEEAA